MYCVYYHSQKFHQYFIYYSDGRYLENTKILPYDNCDNFEHSKLTNKSINQDLLIGKTLKMILKEYCENIQKWRDELLSSQSLIKKFDFFRQFQIDDGSFFKNNNEANIMRFFNCYKSKNWKEEKNNIVSWDEYSWYEKTYNGGLIKFKQGKYNCLGYDFKMSYPTILSSQVYINNEQQIFKMPIYEGKPKKIYKFSKEIDYGLYHVNITCDNEDFKSIFNFKYDTNIYTHFDLEFCLKYKKDFNIKIELIIDDEPNCLIYKKNEITDSANFFKPWFERINELKKEFPNNGLIKQLSSSIWGYLSKTNKRYYTTDEINEKNIEFDYEDDKNLDFICLREKENNNGDVDYMLLNKKKPYCKNYRLKPFITSFQRILLAEIAIKINIKGIVRINTDCIVWNKKLLNKEERKRLKNICPTFIKEEKTTGLYDIQKINKFVSITEL